MAKKEESTAIANLPADEAALLAQFDGDDVFGDVESGVEGEIKLRLPVLQFNHKEHPGKIVDSINPENERTEIDVVFVKAHKYRERTTVDEGEFTVHCKSADAVTGFEEGGAGHPIECATCPFSKWTTGAEGKRTPPACSVAWGVIALDLDAGEPVLVRFTRTSEEAFTSLIQKYHRNVRIGERKLKQLALHRRRYRMALDKQKKGATVWYTPNIQPGERGKQFTPPEFADVVADTLDDYGDKILEVLRLSDAGDDAPAEGSSSSYTDAEQYVDA